jgi:hypothetical protein
VKGSLHIVDLQASKWPWRDSIPRRLNGLRDQAN